MRILLCCLFLALLLIACDGGGDNTADDASAGGTVAVETSTGEKALLEERCTVCHTLDRVFSEKRNEAGWNAVLDDMVGYGAKLDDAERTRLVAYLTSL
ncbi:MAG TPA: hypothetical protein VM054_05195 [bacterium]|nr:hypothetical protein [bacterium]